MMEWRALHGDCLAVLPILPADSVDAVATDPPYELGFMGRAWDRSGVAFRPETWRAVMRVMRPGAHLAAFGGARTDHRMKCAIEDAGFEIRDTVLWLHGQGFPKSRNIGKAIDAEAGAVGASGRRFNTVGQDNGGLNARRDLRSDHPNYAPYAPATPEAAQWQGWGTALKPAFEPIILARKPLIGTVAANVLAHGTGAINVDACRVATDAPRPWRENSGRHGNAYGSFGTGEQCTRAVEDIALGRWPANVMHDGSPEVLAAFAAFGEKNGGHHPKSGGAFGKNGCYGRATGYTQPERHSDTGTAARFFYCAKASKAERAGSKHPTVKPLALMRWLCRLITPPGGLILDPFAGSGTTMEAAHLEGFGAVGIELEAPHMADIRRRYERVGAPLLELAQAAD